jgi:glycosyltransferase involved in cell wall biosynthesis
VTLLFTSTHETPFIVEDLNLLRRHYEVHHLLTRSLLAPVGIARRVWKTDLCFTWFASVYAAAVVFLSGLAGRKCILVIGGADVARVDDAGYGQWRSPWKSMLTGYALRRAWRVLAVDESLKAEAIRRADYAGENIQVVPTGYDPEFWTPGAGPRTRCVLTVAACANTSRLNVKGIPVLFRAAEILPGIDFTVVGIDIGLLRRSGMNVPRNVEILPRVDREALRALYQQSVVYCQPSLFEGLPNSLCESMLCGCIPVATAVGGSARAVGDTGYLVPPRDPEALAQALMLAVEHHATPSAPARARIAEMFTPRNREETLIRLIESAVS